MLGAKPPTPPQFGGSELLTQLAREVEALERQIRARCSHYQLLGVPRDADRKAIKRGFYALAAWLHPDRHSGVALGELKPRMEALLRYVTMAHDVLDDRAERIAYDASLPRPSQTQLPTASPAPPPAHTVIAGDFPTAPQRVITQKLYPGDFTPPPAHAQSPVRLPAAAPPEPVVRTLRYGEAQEPRHQTPPPISAVVAPTGYQPLRPPPVRTPMPSVPEFGTPAATRSDVGTDRDAARREALAKRLLGGRRGGHPTPAPAPPKPSTPPNAAALERLLAQATSAEQLGDYATASRTWRTLLQAAPERHEFAERAAANMLNESPPPLHEAAELVKRVVLADPSRATAYALLARAYVMAGLRSAARRVVQHALSLGHETPQLLQLRHQLAEPSK